ncbi:SDR family NAD(P)-dependent oxidoreductase [Mycobacterium sp. M26]|uniref:SDR family NAD(P)-dependent oxidoreductase n=1 Tax=Mycobacterium sp. M26 TaxID=1762962 RepID=UPI0009E97D8D|nr:SDR family NAD(P)-dependent oxidoreductase [Mycobacterium sp. M26]
MTAGHPVDRFAGSWALVTGSARAEGLGYALARQLAEHRINVVLVDILEADLQTRADELRSAYGIEVRPIAADLGDLASYPRIMQALNDITVDVLICNHMFTPKDTPTILDMDLDVHNAMIDINARAYVNLIHPLATLMVNRGRGAVVVVSSAAGLTPTPYTGAYAGNKAFQIAFGEALWFELRHTGVDVLVVSAGLMDTQGDALDNYPKWQIADPNQCATQILSSIGRKHMITPGRANHLFTLINTRLMSRRRAVETVGRFMEKGLGK